MSTSTSSRIEPLRGRPEFLTLSRWDCGGTLFELASRRRLDTRQVLPYFQKDGVLYVGVLRRERASRLLRGGAVVGLEPIGLDFGGVDETGDILQYGRELFTERTGLVVDDSVLKLPLPSLARSIGYLTELGLPLLVGVRPPASRVLDVAWEGGHHQLQFLPVETLLRSLEAPGAEPHSEDLPVLLRALRPTGTAAFRLQGEEDAWSRELLERQARRIVTGTELAARVQRPVETSGLRRTGEAHGEELRFLSLHRVRHQEQWFEIITPSSGVTVAMLPFVRARGTCYFLLWEEPRVAVLERHVLQPLYDTPLHPRHVNATACFVRSREAESLVGEQGAAELEALVPLLLRRAIGAPVIVRRVLPLGPPAEPAPEVSSELRHRVACELAPAVLEALPSDVLLISAEELARAVSEGWVKDPVLVSGIQQLGPAFGVDPFAPIRHGKVEERLAFLNTMTEGSRVQRRLKDYSSIEREQLQAPTYARLMTLLQHEYGVRVAYPRDESDRGFFKAAYRVFMADGREENRELQGLHWSHDAFHFALGNHTPPLTEDFEDWYVQGRPVPAEPACEGPAFEQYCRALKAAEDESTFFSFWTLHHENLALARHVGKLTFYEALQELGISTRIEAREVFEALSGRGELPEAVAAHPVYQERAPLRELFQYMRGFREYHLKDIREAWRFAARDMYRGVSLRFGIYEGDAERYLAHVRGFQATLEAQLPGLNPLKAACADTRVELCLRVWDVIKALKRVRKAVEGRPEGEAREHRRAFFTVAEEHLKQLEGCHRELEALRAQVVHAELTSHNESLYRTLTQEVQVRVARVRQSLWDAVAATGLLDAAVVEEERTRELPR